MNFYPVSVPDRDPPPAASAPLARCRFCEVTPTPGAATCGNCGAPTRPAPIDIAPGRPVL